MTLVTYSDSENSDSETASIPQPSTEKKAPPKSTKAGSTEFQPLVDRGNPRKIRVNLPEIISEDGAKDGEGDSEPARKKPRIGTGGQFSGFNSLLPAPKRNKVAEVKSGGKDQSDEEPAPARKVFSLKTGATPGFDRNADAETRGKFDQDGAADESGANGGVTGFSANNTCAEAATEAKLEEAPKKKSAMMFKPLSVGRNTTKKKRPAAADSSSSDNVSQKVETKKLLPNEKDASPQQELGPTPKPKINLFGFSKEEKHVPSAPAVQGGYESLVYTPAAPPSAAPPPEDNQQEITVQQAESQAPSAPGSNEATALHNIADDLKLSRAEKRHLFGRNSKSSFTDPSTSSAPRILTFDTDAEYASNQAFLSSTSEAERAALQHNPVRAIAPGKHSLQQLVNVASNQREALEESFASGKRNKQEAGSRYGW